MADDCFDYVLVSLAGIDGGFFYSLDPYWNLENRG